MKNTQDTYLFVGEYIYETLDTLLAHIGPGVARHPLPLAFRAFVLAETPLPALVWSLAFAFGSRLQITRLLSHQVSLPINKISLIIT